MRKAIPFAARPELLAGLHHAVVIGVPEDQHAALAAVERHGEVAVGQRDDMARVADGIGDDLRAESTRQRQSGIIGRAVYLPPCANSRRRAYCGDCGDYGDCGDCPVHVFALRSTWFTLRCAVETITTSRMLTFSGAFTTYATTSATSPGPSGVKPS